MHQLPVSICAKKKKWFDASLLVLTECLTLSLLSQTEASIYNTATPHSAACGSLYSTGITFMLCAIQSRV